MQCICEAHRSLSAPPLESETKSGIPQPSLGRAPCARSKPVDGRHGAFRFLRRPAIPIWRTAFRACRGSANKQWLGQGFEFRPAEQIPLKQPHSGTLEPPIFQLRLDSFRNHPLSPGHRSATRSRTAPLCRALAHPAMGEMGSIKPVGRERAKILLEHTAFGV
jgi:hypothetical protein